MPAYEFRTDDGEIVELFMPFAEFDRRVKDGKLTMNDGRTATSYFNPQTGISTVPSNYPMTCSAAGVHPGQIKEHMDHLKAKGCGQVNHTSDGDVIFESKGQRRKVCEVLGLYDRNGSYGDPQPKVRTTCRKYR
jgi:hypothetical protein